MRLSCETTTATSWSGGNINGGIIAKSIHMGVMEMHMWPYEGDEITKITTSANIDVKKTFTGDWTDREFTFKIELAEDQDTAGITNTRFPMEMSISKDGVLDFPEIYFYLEGTYYFEISEVIPDDHDQTNIDYDMSVYMLEVEVEQNIDNRLSITSQKLYKIKDSEGQNITNYVYIDSDPDNELAVFENKEYVDGEVAVGIVANKTYTGTDISLETFSFCLDTYPSGSIPEGIINTNFPIEVSPNISGHIIFSDIVFDKVGDYEFYIYEQTDKTPADDDSIFENVVYDESVYKLYVTVTADGTKLKASYVMEQIYDINGDELNPPVAIEDLTGILFENRSKLPILPRTGGVGVYGFYIIGLLLMASAVVMLIIKKRKEKNV